MIGRLESAIQESKQAYEKYRRSNETYIVSNLKKTIGKSILTFKEENESRGYLANFLGFNSEKYQKAHEMLYTPVEIKRELGEFEDKKLTKLSRQFYMAFDALPGENFTRVNTQIILESFRENIENSFNYHLKKFKELGRDLSRTFSLKSQQTRAIKQGHPTLLSLIFSER